MTTSMDGKVALVTGGSTGIGRAVALAFGAAGAKVVICARHAAAGEEVVRAIGDSGGEAIFVQADVTRASEVAALIEQTVATYGRLDYACNNAGVGGSFASTADFDEDEWDQIIATNLKGVWLCMKYEIPQMLKQGGGAIVNIASAGGLVGVPGLPAYTASKHGVVGLTKVTALEYAQAGIRVNSVCPGTIRTPMVDAAAKSDPNVEAMMLSLHPIGRLGMPDEISGAVLFLCSDAASFITGHAMLIDGGATAR